MHCAIILWNERILVATLVCLDCFFLNTTDKLIDALAGCRWIKHKNQYDGLIYRIDIGVKYGFFLLSKTDEIINFASSFNTEKSFKQQAIL